MRNTARRLLGDMYAERMAEIGKSLKLAADRAGTEPLEVAIDVCKQRDITGIDMMQILSAAVELIEPTATNPTTDGGGQ